MLATTERYVRALDAGGIALLIHEVIDAEIKNTTHKSKIYDHDHAGPDIAKGILSIPENKLAGIITGRVLRDSLRPPPIATDEINPAHFVRPLVAIEVSDSQGHSQASRSQDSGGNTPMRLPLSRENTPAESQPPVQAGHAYGSIPIRSQGTPVGSRSNTSQSKSPEKQRLPETWQDSQTYTVSNIPSDDEGDESDDGSQEIYTVEKIISSIERWPDDGIDCDPPFEPQEHTIFYRIRWKDWPPDRDTWEPRRNLHKSKYLVYKFHVANPLSPMYVVHGNPGVERNTTGLYITTQDLGPAIIYANWLLDNSGTTHMNKVPSANVLLDIATSAVYYMKSNLTGHELVEQKEYIKKVDNECLKAEYGIAAPSPGGWDEAMNDGGMKKHLNEETPAKNKIKHDLLVKWADIIRKKVNEVPADERDQPFPYAFSEVGFTKNPETRRKDHTKHTGSNPMLMFIEDIAIANYAGKYRWKYLPIAKCFTGDSGSYLECFMSELCQSYTWQGGMNGVVAGTSVSGLTKQSHKEISGGFHFDANRWDLNLEASARKVDILTQIKEEGDDLDRLKTDLQSRKARRDEDSVRQDAKKKMEATQALQREWSAKLGKTLEWELQAVANAEQALQTHIQAVEVAQLVKEYSAAVLEVRNLE